MTREEIKKAIENGESVWAYDDFLHRVIPYKANEIAITGINTNMPAYELKDLFATKQQAEHYLHHANVSRIEHLPFLTWEEFLKEYSFDFYSENREWFTLYWNDADGIVLESIDGFDKKTWDLTEENFYKAYDECVRLFKGQ